MRTRAPRDPFRRFLLLTVAATCACRPAAQDAGDPASVPRGAPAVTRVASIPLHEDDRAPLGGYLFVSRAHNGELFISDMANSRVVIFDAGGTAVRIIGQKGAGPGEFHSPGVNALLGEDSLLAVIDVSSRRLSLFRAADGVFLRSVLLPASDVGINWTLARDTATFALGSSPAIFATWSWRSDSIASFGTTPQRLLDDPFTVLQHGRPEVSRVPRGIVALLPTEPGLHLLDASGRSFGFVLLPARRRKGAPDDLLRRAAAAQASGPMGLAPVGSAVVGMHALSTGALVTVMLDVDQLAAPLEGRPGAQLFGNFRLYASLIRSDLSAACVDAPIPSSTDIAPLPFFTGDTLWVLSRGVLDNDAVETRLEGFLVGEEGCEWLPTNGVAAPRP